MSRSIVTLPDQWWTRTRRLLDYLERAKKYVSLHITGEGFAWMSDFDIDFKIITVSIAGVGTLLWLFLKPLKRLNKGFERYVGRWINLESVRIGYSASQSEIAAITCSADDCSKTSPCTSCQERLDSYDS